MNELNEFQKKEKKVLQNKIISDLEHYKDKKIENWHIYTYESMIRNEMSRFRPSDEDLLRDDYFNLNLESNYKIEENLIKLNSIPLALRKNRKELINCMCLKEIKKYINEN